MTLPTELQEQIERWNIDKNGKHDGFCGAAPTLMIADKIICDLVSKHTALRKAADGMREALGGSRKFLAFVTCSSFHAWDTLDEATMEIKQAEFWERKLVECQKEAMKQYEPVFEAITAYDKLKE